MLTVDLQVTTHCRECGDFFSSRYEKLETMVIRMPACRCHKVAHLTVGVKTGFLNSDIIKALEANATDPENLVDAIRAEGED